jgi:hypothetical protein
LIQFSLANLALNQKLLVAFPCSKSLNILVHVIFKSSNHLASFSEFLYAPVFSLKSGCGTLGEYISALYVLALLPVISF